jgi:hypothetical protein
LATPNYGYEKRQKELAKKRKKEDKLKAKAERKTDSPDEFGQTDVDTQNQAASDSDSPQSAN